MSLSLSANTRTSGRSSDHGLLRCERLESRRLLAISGIGEWVVEGPLGARDVVTGFESVGSVEMLAPHPDNADILYIASVSGGVWRTENATSIRPIWEPLTDQMPSLSLGAIAFDPMDASYGTIWASNGEVSSGSPNGPMRGLIRTNDGGESWTELGVTNLQGQSIVSIVPTTLQTATGQVILVAGSSGVWRSQNGGQSFTLLNVQSTSGLPSSASASDLLIDPTHPDRFYAALPGHGVFRSKPFSTGLIWEPFSLGLTGVDGTNRILIASHFQAASQVHALYTATISDNKLNNVYRWSPGGAAWLPLGSVPNVSGGGQGDIHLAIEADPIDPGVVYVGGDFAGWGDGAPTFRWNPTTKQWVSLTGANANNTIHHPDTRDFAFDANGDLLAADDGGVYRLFNTNQPSQNWQPVIGNLATSEVVSVSYDPANKIFFAGLWDNGTVQEFSPSSGVWSGLYGGDGGTTGVGLEGAFVYRYHVSNNLIDTHRSKYNSSNSLIEDQRLLLAAVGSDDRLSGLNNADAAIGTSPVPPVMVVNEYDPKRLLISGLTGLYESTADRGDHIAEITTAGMGDTWSLAYGGKFAGQVNSGLIYAGTRNGLWLRTGNTGSLTRLTTFPGSIPTQIVLDPDDWHTAYILDTNRHVWQTTDAGATSAGWTDLTGNLTGAPNSLTVAPVGLEIYKKNGNTVLIVSGVGGIFRRLLSSPTWTELGHGLPNTVAMSVNYDHGSLSTTSDDLMYVGTWGRGVWSMSNPSQYLLADTTLVVNGEYDFGNQNDTIRIVQNPTNPMMIDIHHTSPIPHTVYSVETTAIRAIHVNAKGGADRIEIDKLPPGVTVVVDAGDGDDLIEIAPLSRNLEVVRNQVSLVAGPGKDTVRFNDQGRQDISVYTISVDSVSRPGVSLNIGAAESVFVVGCTDQNLFNVTGVALGRSLTLYGNADADTFQVGASNKLAPIAGKVYVHGFGGYDSLILNDQAATVNQVFSVTDSDVTWGALSATGYAGIESLTLHSGNGVNGPDVTAGNVIRLRSAMPGMAIEVSSGSGNDTIDYGTGELSDLQANVTVQGGAGIDSLWINDQYSSIGGSYRISAGRFVRPELWWLTDLEHAGMEVLKLNAQRGNDLITVESTGTLTSLEIEGTAGKDSITLGGPKGVQQIQSQVVLTSNAGTAALLVDDTLNPLARTISVSSSMISGLSPGVIVYANSTLASLTIAGGSGSNSITIVGTPTTESVNKIPVFVRPGRKNDIVRVVATDGPLVVGAEGTDSVFLGNSGRVSEISQPVHFRAFGRTSGLVNLQVDAFAETLPATVTLSPTSLLGLTSSPIYFESSTLRSLKVLGGIGADTYQVIGMPSHETLQVATTLATGNGADSVTVSSLGNGPVVIDGQDGNDTIIIQSPGSRSPQVTIMGGLGNDTLTGSLGPETFEGGPGQDRLIGGDGNDTYLFDADTQLGHDTIVELLNAGTDGLYFGATEQFNIAINLAQSAGLQQTINPNLMLTFEQAESIEDVTGTSGDDALFGNSLHNRLRGAAGDDLLAGHSGNDTYAYFDSDAGRDTITESDRTGGQDTIDFGGILNEGVIVNLANLGQVTSTIAVVLTNADTVEHVIGSARSDRLFGNAQDNRLTGGSGDDTITGGPGDDTLIGGRGDDTYEFDTDGAVAAVPVPLGSDLIVEAPPGSASSPYGVPGDPPAGLNDTLDFSLTTRMDVRVDLSMPAGTAQTVNAGLTITFSAANTMENIIGGSGHDVLIGSSAANVLQGGPGNDTQIGGAGNDTYLFAANTALGSDTLDESGGGTDTLNFTATMAAGISVDLGVATPQTVNGKLQLKLSSGRTFEKVIGSPRGDRITGNALANILSGLAGNDTLSGGAGNDTLIGGAGNDTYAFAADVALGKDFLDESGGGLDTLDFSATTALGVNVNLATATAQFVNSRLVLVLGSGALLENIIGSAQNDILSGNALANSIFGGPGSDQLNGALGNDILTGDAGDDTLTGGSGNDTYVFDTDLALGSDTVIDSDGVDTLNFSATTSRSLTVDLSRSAAQVVNAGLTLSLSSSSVENVLGGALGDTLIGNSLANVLSGSAGNDTIRGAAGQDILLGGLGADILKGEADEDLLLGGTTSQDDSVSALVALLMEWGRIDQTYAQRIGHLSTVSGGKNGSVVLNSTTVQSDANAADELTGGSPELDWFFVSLGDLLVDAVAGETKTTI